LHPFEAEKTSNHSFALMSGGSMEVDMMELEAGKYSIKSFTIVKKATYIFENKLDDSR
jgi:hypothetical protein